MSSGRELVRDWLPPALLRAFMRARGDLLEFREGFSSWNEALAYSNGYDAPVILKRTLAATRRVLSGEAAWCRDGVAFNHLEYSWPLMAALMRVASRNGNCIRVLDFGGALGCTYMQHRAVLRSLAKVEWLVVEQPAVAQCARSQVAVDGLQFYDDISSALSEGPPDMVLLSSVLQYLEDPARVMRELHLTGARSMVIDRTPIHDQGDASLLVVQHSPRRTYSASYPCRIFSRVAIREMLRGWDVEWEYPSQEGRFQLVGGRSFEFLGMLLELRR